MIAPRKALLRKLQTLWPAVGDGRLVRVLTHCLFSGEHLVAYNDRIALSVPQHSDFKGCIPAAVLTEILEASRAAVVEMRPVGSDVVLVKLGDTSVMLPMLPADTFRFQMPAVPTQNHIQGVARQFFDAVEHCLGSVGSEARVYEQLGVTFIPNGSKVRLYAFDIKTMSFAQLALPRLGLKEKAILPADFCRQMLALAEQAHSTRLALPQRSPKRSRLADALADHALFLADDTLLFGRVLRSDKNQIDFDRAFKREVPADYAKAMVAIPQQLQMALKRATLLADYGVAELAIENGKATFRSGSERGEISDTIPLPGHADITALVDAPLLFDRHAKFDNILFTDSCAIMAKDDHLCVVANPTSARSDSS